MFDYGAEERECIVELSKTGTVKGRQSSFSLQEEILVRNYFISLGETDQGIITETIGICHQDSEARAFWLNLSNLKNPVKSQI